MIADGTYKYRAVQPYGPSTECCVVVAGGHVSEWTVNGLSDEAIQARQDLYDNALLTVLRGETCYGTSEVEFTPAPKSASGDDVVPTYTVPAPKLPTKPSTTEVIGDGKASELHRELVRYKIRNHDDFASEVLARKVESFATLTYADEQAILDYLYTNWGLA